MPYVCVYIYIYTDLCLMKEHCAHRTLVCAADHGSPCPAPHLTLR